MVFRRVQRVPEQGSASTTSKPARLAALRHRDFRLFWSGQLALGCCQILFSTGCNTTIQLDTLDALRGRVMGLYAIANAGMTPFGSLLIGTLAEHLGVRAGRRRRPRGGSRSRSRRPQEGPRVDAQPRMVRGRNSGPRPRGV